MDTLSYNFSLLSDTFAHGAYQTQNFNRPELRAPSVKGMIRWWHEALGFSKADARKIFGQVSDRRNGIEGNFASLVTIRVSAVAPVRTEKADFMPHKGAHGGSKTAIQAGMNYVLVLTQRREGLPPALWDQLRSATEAWLLLGAIGQRSNRAAGSILWDQAPRNRKDFEIKASEALGNAKISFAVLGKDFDRNERDARRIAGDFLKDDAFNGAAPFGSARPRKPSPLKLKCVELDGAIRLLAMWDSRFDSRESLKMGVRVMVTSNKEIGRLLEEVLPILTS